MMKYIKSASYDANFGELERIADDAGYNIYISDDNEMTVVAKSKADMKPTFEVFTTIEDGKVWYTPIMSFPDIDMRDSSYYDDAEYYVGQWMKAAKLCTAIVEYEM